MTWTCPRCGRSFRNQGQWHSCVQIRVEDHLADASPAVVAIFSSVRDHLLEFDGVRMDAVQGGVQFVAKRRFASCTIQKTGVRLSFASPDRIDDPRIARCDHFSANIWDITMRLKEPIDGQVKAWLRAAYEMP